MLKEVRKVCMAKNNLQKNVEMIYKKKKIK